MIQVDLLQSDHVELDPLVQVKFHFVIQVDLLQPDS